MILFEILAPKGCLMGSVMAAVDVLREANMLSRARAGRRLHGPLAWRVVNEAGRSLAAVVHCYTSREESDAARRKPTQRVLVVPPLMWITIPGLRRLVQQNAAVIPVVKEAYAQGSWVGACGTGLWLVARAGIVDHQPVPLSWLLQSRFAQDFPAVSIASESPLLVSSHMVLASAPNLMHELMLRLLDGVGLSDLASAAQEKLVVDPERQRLVVNIPEQVVGVSRDAPLYRAISWMESNAGRAFSIAEVAAVAAVSERTLSRLFHEYLGRSPLRYLNELRVKRAQMWLQATWRSVHEIAIASGYSEPAAFRRMFQRTSGMTPSEYRRRFTLRTPRAIWQVPPFEEVLE
ncbi:helix-turn-helix domain-containing protein [Noviherbaspirillum sp. CPCC 100848]|uniref:Helix-turn-helix domain-containing protein n=1 Tax=Noviherbaspirillum album TaxID=3080276 RepID=A0ABU6JJD4_9BURK|nr:helix-turn-helix domain-containing protein [Noviherbaspirillum sp. CPCC 100848]MEC4723385.1 helix-turn-helix domain-containing protein [Noviherbaspirillum sp. CPCC 100848]